MIVNASYWPLLARSSEVICCIIEAMTNAPELIRKRDELVAWIQALDSCAVAYSGGVDSAVVAKAALLALGENAVAVTGVSPSLAANERTLARETALEIGIRHRELDTNEFANEQYTRNAPDRCFHCKTQLYSQLQAVAGEWGFQAILNGANVDDLGDYRPGLQAASDHRVLSPLVECGFNKSEVRELARYWELPVWDKPASPCLSSRIAYGEEVTPERLKMVDAAESFLRSCGLVEFRVRYHRNDLARIEVSMQDLSQLCQPELRSRLVEQFRKIGFRFVTVDLEGFRSGSLNDLVTLEVLTDD